MMARRFVSSLTLSFFLVAALIPQARLRSSEASPRTDSPNASIATALSTGPEGESAAKSIEYLARTMDQFHNRFVVYENVSEAGNHFHTFTKFPGADAPVTINGSFTNSPHDGATSLQCVYSDTTGTRFGGFVFQNGVLREGDTAPQPNFGTEPEAGIDLSGVTELTFWARGKNGGEIVTFFMGGVGRNENTGAVKNPCTPNFSGPCPHPDSTPAVRIIVTLSAEWKQYRINLEGKDLKYVLGGFGWGVDGSENLAGAEFYLDDIQYELGPELLERRLNEPRLLKSFDTAPFQLQPPPVKDFDLVLRNSAFTYDNALALLAFLASGTADGLRRAKLIGDAFVYASQHDRAFNDGRLRSDYAAGDISLPPGWTPNGRKGTVPIPGFFKEDEQRFIEIEQKGIDTGNNTWALLALAALFERTGIEEYVTTARTLGNFIRTFRNDTGTFQGFQAGLDNFPESPSVTRRPYASAEHNIDVVAAFTTMFRITGESQWANDARHAREFLEAMWDPQKGCYLAGTINPDTLNKVPDQLPLDVQIWSVLATRDALALHPRVLGCAEQNHATSSDGFSGFDFNNDKDAVWFEGTAQMAVAYALTGQLSKAQNLRLELRRAQQTPPFGDTLGIVAASHDGLTTGFHIEEDIPFLYFRRPHVAVAAWNVFGQLGLNPYFINENRIDNVNFFVSQHYSDFLSREPDPFGLAFWINEITACGDDAACIELKQINVSAAFYLSIEFKETGYLVYKVYKAAYGDTSSPNVTVPVPIIRLNEFQPDSRRIGQGVQVGIGDWKAQLETNKNDFMREFVLRERFLSAYPLSMPPTEFVNRLNQNAGGVLSQTERDHLIAELAGAADVSQGRASVLRKIAEDADLHQREFNRAFVLMQYYGYLRRNPNDAPDSDFRGWEFWLNKLNQFNGDFVRAEMVKAFLVSIEYRTRFGQ
jgi:hypothetical protein